MNQNHNLPKFQTIIRSFIYWIMSLLTNGYQFVQHYTVVIVYKWLQLRGKKDEALNYLVHKNISQWRYQSSILCCEETIKDLLYLLELDETQSELLLDTKARLNNVVRYSRTPEESLFTVALHDAFHQAESEVEERLIVLYYLIQSNDLTRRYVKFRQIDIETWIGADCDVCIL